MSSGPRTFDRGAILAFVARYAGQPGADPSLTLDPWYWVGRILVTGGLGPDNEGYWIGRFFGAGGDEKPDPFPLELGPLDPLEEEMTIFPDHVDSFASLVSEHLAELNGADGVLQSAGDAIAQGDLAGGLDNSFRQRVDPAAAAHANTRAALDEDDLSDVIAATEGHGPAIDAGEGAYNEDLPPDLASPDPGDPPPPVPDDPPREPPQA